MKTRILMLLLMAALSISTHAAAQSCAADPVAVQILGSGGPSISRERASSSYLLWVGPQAKMLVDMGGGRLILSHIGTFDVDAAVAEVKTTYSGALTVGADLQCTPVQ